MIPAAISDKSFGLLLLFNGDSNLRAVIGFLCSVPGTLTSLPYVCKEDTLRRFVFSDIFGFFRYIGFVLIFYSSTKSLVTTSIFVILRSSRCFIICSFFCNVYFRCLMRLLNCSFVGGGFGRALVF